jgi:protein gp37
MMKTGWLVLALGAAVAGCTQHSPGWDDAWAACEAEAIEAMEAADPDHDQRSEWQDNYIDQCMDKKGFKEKSTI